MVPGLWLCSENGAKDAEWLKTATVALVLDCRGASAVPIARRGQGAQTIPSSTYLGGDGCRFRHTGTGLLSLVPLIVCCVAAQAVLNKSGIQQRSVDMATAKRWDGMASACYIRHIGTHEQPKLYCETPSTLDGQEQGLAKSVVVVCFP